MPESAWPIPPGLNGIEQNRHPVIRYVRKHFKICRRPPVKSGCRVRRLGTVRSKVLSRDVPYLVFRRSVDVLVVIPAKFVSSLVGIVGTTECFTETAYDDNDLVHLCDDTDHSFDFSNTTFWLGVEPSPHNCIHHSFLDDIHEHSSIAEAVQTINAFQTQRNRERPGEHFLDAAEAMGEKLVLRKIGCGVIIGVAETSTVWPELI